MKHTPLFVVALLAILFLMLPYVLLLLFNKALCKAGGSHRRLFLWLASLLPLFDAYTAPYKPAYQFWMGFLLLVRAVLLIVFAMNHVNDPIMNLMAISFVILLVLTLAWILGGVFKRKSLDILEASFLLNLGVFTVATHYLVLHGGSQAALAYCSTGIVFAEFIGILVYHVIAKTRCGKRYARKLLSTHVQDLMSTPGTVFCSSSSYRSSACQ